MLVNARIREAGLFYNGHYNFYCLRIVVDLRGGGANLELPVNKTREFMSMFGEELDLENGVFVHDLKGVPVRLKTTGEDTYGKIVAIGDILAAEDELMPID